LRLAGINPCLGENRHQCCPEGLERLLGVPDVEHLDLAAGFESEVMQPSGRRAPAPAPSSRLITSSYFSGVNGLGVK